MNFKWFAALALLVTCLLIGAGFAKAEEPTDTNICGLSQNRIDTYLERIEPFRRQIQTTLRDFNVDENFVWLALIESGGKSEAESNRGAAGIWQLTEQTARHYGCSDRSDVECSTKAAAQYLSKLHKDFGNDVWKVVVAYNMGGSNYRRRGKPTAEAKKLANTVTCLMEFDYGND